MDLAAPPALRTITFLFTDIEASTRLWEQRTAAMRADLARHDQLLHQAIAAHGGHVFKTMGDAFCVALPSAQAALLAATAAQAALQQDLPQLRVRMAIHTGEAEERGGDYFGPALNHVARLLAAGHGGQILLSERTVEQLRSSLPPPLQLRSLGVHRLRDMGPSPIFQLLAPHLWAEFPPLNTLDVAFRRGLFRAAVIAAVILAIVSGLAVMAARNARLARAQQRELRRNLYAADMNLARQALEALNVEQARALLRAYEPQPGEEELRSWEWRYLRAQTGNQSIKTVRQHTGVISGLARSPNGERLATAGADGTIRLWTAKDLRQILVLYRPGAGKKDRWVLDVAFSPDGQQLASVGRDGRVEVWDLTRRRILRSWAAEAPHRAMGMKVSFSARTIVTTGGSGLVQFWDASSGKRSELPLRVATVEAPQSSDRRHLAVMRPEGVLLLSVAERRRVGLYPHVGYPWALARGGRRLAAGTHSGSLNIWDLGARQARITARVPLAPGTSAFSPNGQILAVAERTTLHLWDVAHRREMATLRGHARRISALTFSLDGETVVTGSEAGDLKLWRVTRSPKERLVSGVFPTVAFSQQEPLLVASAQDRIEAWDTRRGWKLAVLRKHKGWVDRFSYSPVAVSPLGDRVASGSEEGIIRLWDYPSRRLRTSFRAGGQVVRALAFSPNGRLLVAGISGRRDTTQGRVQVWDVTSGRAVMTLNGFSGAVWQIAFSPDGALLAVGSQDEPVRLWNVETWAEQARTTLPLHSPSLSFSPDGRYLAAGGFEGEIGVWDLVLWRPRVSLSNDQMPALSVAFSPDGKSLAACLGGTVRMWNTATWRPTITLPLHPHGEEIRWVGFLPDGQVLAVGSTDNTIRFWRAPPLPELTTSSTDEE